MRVALNIAGALCAVLAIAACEPRKISQPAAGPAETASLIVRGDRLFIPARINGTETDALLDSGAELSFADKAFAEEIGLVTAGSETARGTGGEEEVTFAQGVSIETAGIVLEDRMIAVLDLSELSARLIGAPLTFVVGRDLFDAARLSIDIEAGRIETVARDSEPAGVKLLLDTQKGIETIPVSVEGGAPVQADFDLGNGSEVLIGAAYAERMGLTAPERIVGQKTGGGIGGEVTRDLVVLRELEIAGVAFHDVAAAIDRTENAADVNVGVRVLRNFRMTVDFAEKSLWLEAQ
jgi:predicted aspartyl protease